MRPDLQARLDSVKKPYNIFTDVVEDAAAEQFIDCMEQPSVIEGCLMPDTHAGYVAPIGSVLLTKDTIFPSFVGYDIGCGMSSVTIDNLKADDVTKDQWEAIKNQILRDIPIGFSRHSKSQTMPTTILGMPSTDFAKDVILSTGRFQIGTLGGGNHFLEIGSTKSGGVAVVIHSGSRGVGHKIATHYMKEAAIANTDEERYKDEFNLKNKDWYNSFAWNHPLKRGEQEEKYEKARKEFVYRRVRARVDNIEDAYALDVNTQLGKDYINDMNMALEFALANRKAMIDKVVYALGRILKKDISFSRFINRNHNHAELTDEGWIHRKGATQAWEGMLGVIPGNMVDGSFIVRGKGSRKSLYSSSHGAGRVLSRRKAKEQISVEDFNECTKHLIANHSEGNVDEAPAAYKDIYEVMDLQKDLVEVLDQVTPILNIKG